MELACITARLLGSPALFSARGLIERSPIITGLWLSPHRNYAVPVFPEPLNLVNGSSPPFGWLHRPNNNDCFSRAVVPPYGSSD